MQAILVTIGDEILIGRTVDTNSAWMAERLNAIGISVLEILSISDTADAICRAAELSLGRADLVLLTGGLGPTKDDITKATLADYFGMDLVEHDEVRANIIRLFEKWGRPVPELSNSVAKVPEGSRVFINDRGTAAGMWFEQEGKVLISMPGVPHEMKHLLGDKIMPAIQERFPGPALYHRHLMTSGIGESRIAGLVEDLEDSLPPHIKLAYLPSSGAVKLRLTGRGQSQESLVSEVDAWLNRFEERVAKYVYGHDDKSLPEAVLDKLRIMGLSLGIAESCTGGKIAARVVAVPGCSDVFMGGTVAYSNDAKVELLGVDREELETKGAVSTSTVHQMLDGAIKAFNTDCAIATSGIAGPGGGLPSKPVGTVYIGVMSPQGRLVKRFNFPGNREINMELTTVVAFTLLYRLLAGSLELEREDKNLVADA